MNMEENKRSEELEEVTSAQETPAEETAPEETAAAEEAVSPEVTAEEKPAQEKKATPAKMALVIAAIVVLLAVIAVLVLQGGKGPQTDPGEDLPVEITEPVPTIPADGNPDDETCKGSYTVTDAEAVAQADTVVATIGDYTLTGGQLQMLYWMQVQNFLSSEIGSYMLYYGMLDYTQPLDVQPCAMAEKGTWQQFFLKEALNTWQRYCASADRAKAAGMELTAEEKEYLAGMEENLTVLAQEYQLEGVDALLKENFGAGLTLEDYVSVQELQIQGSKYYYDEYDKLTVTQEEMEAYFAEHETECAEIGITKEGKYVNVRHILFTPEGGTTDESGVTTYSEKEWADCKAKAEDIMNMWTAGSKTEESFAALATAMTQDPGSKETGGLYENVEKGQMVEEFDAWCFDEKREPGHHGMVKTRFGYHLMYFVDSNPIWEVYARQQLMAEKTKHMMEELIAQYPMDVNYSAISLGLVDLARG